MSFWKNLFGGGAAKDEPAGDKVMEQESYKGFVIKAIEMKVGGELQLAGLIEKDVGGEPKSYRYIRAERMASRDDLIPLALAKGRQIIDEQGEQVFR